MLWGEKNVAHNDVNVRNIMVSEVGRVSLIDFGGVTFGEVSNGKLPPTPTTTADHK